MLPVQLPVAVGGVEAPTGAAGAAVGGVGEKERFPHVGHSRMVGITPFPQLEQYWSAITKPPALTSHWPLMTRPVRADLPSSSHRPRDG